MAILSTLTALLVLWVLIAAAFVQKLEAADITFQVGIDFGKKSSPTEKELNKDLAEGLRRLGEYAYINIQDVFVKVEGATSLPDPEPLNAFLANNSSMLNPLFPSHPPLQLQKCNASLYRTPFDYYMIQHNRGCDKAPGMLRDQKRQEATLIFDTVVWFATLGLIPLLVLLWWTGYLQLIGEFFILLEERAKAQRVAAAVPVSSESNEGSIQSNPASDLRELWAMTTFLGASVAFILYLVKYGWKYFVVVPLPDPANLNEVFASSGQNVTLHLCTIRKMSQVYLGFEDSCSQVQDFIFSKASPPFETAHGAALTILIAIVAFLSFSAWPFLAFGMSCWVCTCKPAITEIKNLVLSANNHRVYNVELQTPPEAAV